MYINFAKYYHASKIVLLLGASSPIRFLGWLFADALLLVAFYFLFKQLFEQKPIVEGFTFGTFFTYYAITMVIKKMTTSLAVAGIIRNQVKSGDFSFLLLKPVNIVLYISMQFFSRRIVEFILPICLVALVSLSAPHIINRPTNAIYFLISFVFGIVLGQLFYAILGTLAFWVTETWGYMSFLNRIVGLLAGNIIPLDLMPGAIVMISAYLPFKYMHYVPIMIYLDRYTQIEIMQQIAIQFVIIVLLYLIYKYFWFIGLKKYGAVGN